MNVAWIVYGPLDQRTGGTIYDALVVAGLIRSGVTVRVHASLPHRAPMAPPLLVHDRRGSPPGASALVRRLAAERPDVIVGDELCFPHLAFVLPRVAFARRVVLVHHLTCWETELRRGPRARARKLEAIALRHADSVITTSAATRDRLALEGCRRQIDVVTPGANRLNPIGRGAKAGERHTEILFVGAIVARKRVVELVEAFAEGAEADARLTLAGSRERDPRYAREVERLIATRGLSDRVRTVGEIDDSDLAEHLARADLLVLGSSVEGYGIAATEALRAGVPVLAARTPGLVEALSACPGAAIFFEQPDELVRALSRVTREASAREELAAAASAAAPRLPTWETCVEAFRVALERSP